MCHIIIHLSEIVSPSEQCKKIIKQLFEHTETHPNIIAFIFHAKHPEFLSDERLLCNTSPFIKLRNTIEKGINKGEFQKIDIWVATTCIFGSATRMIQLRLDGVIEKPLPEYTEITINTAWQGIKRNEYKTKNMLSTDTQFFTTDYTSNNNWHIKL